MPRFRYQHGEKPLEGFTIEHGLGVGGFGEVYYAISDAGREVALKAVQNYEEIELRGIRQCMNLKSPHLVTVFDVKHNEQGQPFVIMEYVQGPSLRQLLDNAPGGLGTTKAAFFLREIAKGLSYLHDAGVVHRDLKPHNVFYEEGYVKIGDYSLCKMMSTSHRTGHTMTVGTVHYMAPEISEGRYDASVDIYALGVMLYEMLTGSPPFVGDSIGEVLMKSMTVEPDLSQVSEPFRSAIAKALAKDPEKRFSCAAELVEAVFGVEHVQNSVVEFNPQELTIVAEHAAKRVLATPSGRPATGGSAVRVTENWQPAASGSQKRVFVAEPAPSVSHGDTNKTSADYTAPVPPPAPRHEPVAVDQRNVVPALAPDVISPVWRYGLATVVCVLIAIVSQLSTWMAWNSSPGTFSASPYVFPASASTIVALHIVLTFLVITVVRIVVLKNMPIQSKIKGRLAIAVGLIVGTGLGLMPRIPLVGGVYCVAIPLIVLNWHQFIHPRRRRRLVLWPVLASSLISFVCALIVSNWYREATMFHFGYVVESVPILCAAVTAGVGLCLQIASPKQLPLAALSAAHDVTMDYQRRPAAGAASAQAVPGAPTPPPTTAKPELNPPSTLPAPMTLRSMLVVPGIGLFAVSSILAVLGLSSTVEGAGFLDRDVVNILATVGFGLVLGSMGCMIASGTRREWSFLRLIAATGMLAAIHYACLTHQMSVSPLYLPVAIVLFAWPTASQQPES